MKFIVRKVELKDAAAISLLSREGLGYDCPTEGVESKLKKLLADSSHVIFIAESESGIIGFVHAQEYDVLYDDTLMNILGIAVTENARRTGIGKALLSAAEDEAKARSCAGVRLNSGGSRKGAHAFYESCGYTDRKEQLRFIKYI